MNEELRHQLHKLGGDFDKYRPSDTMRGLAAREVRAMVEAWDSLQSNSAGDWETPEEEFKYWVRLIAAGTAILNLAELFLDEEL